MRRVAIFTEGKTEQILVREALLRLIDNSKLSFECYELLAHQLLGARYNYPRVANPNAKIFFMIVEAHGDAGVLSAIKERECSLIEKGNFDVILGVRDMYSDAYEKLAHGKISDAASKRLVQIHAEVVRTMTYRDRIKILYAIMEAESWFLGMYNLFEKIDPIMTAAYINKKLGIDLRKIDPQLSFYKPSEQLASILSLCGMEYKKKESEIEALCSKIEIQDLNDIIIDNRCKSFGEFRKTITENT